MIKDEENTKVIFPELSYKIVGLLFEVHSTLGRYCQEKQYGDALELLLKSSGLQYIREFRVESALATLVPNRNTIDFLIDDKIILELKAKQAFTKEDYFQTQRYLKNANRELALLVNFRFPQLKVKRILNSH